MKRNTSSLVGKGASFFRFLWLLSRGSGSRALPRSGFDFDFDKGVLEIVGVDHVVLDADRARVGAAGFEIDQALFLAVVDLEPPIQQRHHDIVMAMAMPAGFRTRSKAPLGDDDALVLDLLGGDGLRAFRHAWAPILQRVLADTIHGIDRLLRPNRGCQEPDPSPALLPASMQVREVNH